MGLLLRRVFSFLKAGRGVRLAACPYFQGCRRRPCAGVYVYAKSKAAEAFRDVVRASGRWPTLDDPGGWRRPWGVY